jgi:hypothetical protein
MPVANLKNITIDERQTINGETFFVIKSLFIKALIPVK